MTKVSIRGVNVEVVSTEEGEKTDAVVCMRVFDMPIPPVPAQIDHCVKCGERVWVSKLSPRKPRRVCTHCVD
jgi:hypothetical protein